MKRKLVIDSLILILFISGFQVLRSCKKIEKLMAVVTEDVSNILTNSADVSGSITTLGESAIQHGHCYSKTPNATTVNNKTDLGIPSGLGSFKSHLSDLEAGTVYYVKAYMSNGTATVYGKEVSFSTVAASPPTLSTVPVSTTTSTSAKSGGSITNDGGAKISVRGVCWGTSAGPSLSNTSTSDGTGTGDYTSNITGLAPSTTYFVRAYATNSAGTAYGNELTFTTLCTAPTASTNTATNITENSAVVNGFVNANGYSTIIKFDYGPTIEYGSIINAEQSPATGNANTLSSAVISNLTPGAQLHFRVNASSCGGVIYGEDKTFRTLCKLPLATTDAPADITPSSALLKGTVNTYGISTTVIFEYGSSISYGSTIAVSPSPVTGTGNTSVSASLNGLKQNETLHYRVKAENCGGITFGNDQVFNTPCELPQAFTRDASALGSSTVTLNGYAISHSNNTLLSFEYGTTTAYGSTIIAKPDLISDVATPTANISGLQPNTIYHYRISAVSCGGTVSGSDMTFKTLSSVTDIDGNTYSTIKIGTQIWMRENLKVTKYRNNDLIGTTSSATQDISGESNPKYQWAYEGIESNAATYGRLYTWYAVTDSRLVCPNSWHLPSSAEWDTLALYLGGTSVAGGKIKEAGTSHFQSPNTGATNESGFTAISGGIRNITYFNYFFCCKGTDAYWWSATEYSQSEALRWGVNDSNSDIYKYQENKKNGFSIRCVKD